MSKGSQKPHKAAVGVPTGYEPLLAELKSRVRAAQVKAALSVNRELIALYCDIGRVILQRQGWDRNAGVQADGQGAHELRADPAAAAVGPGAASMDESTCDRSAIFLVATKLNTH